MHETTEQVSRTSTLPKRVARALATRSLSRIDSLTCFDGVPELIVDDTEFRHLLHDPQLQRIEPRPALSTLGILEIGMAVPDDPPDIEFVVEDPGSAS